MDRHFVIPSDPGRADALAGELGELATATEWKRAAIVYARVQVYDNQGRPSAEKVNSDLLSPAEYAAVGIHGLRSKTTVRAYWRAWDKAVTERLALEVSLGDAVELPDAEWADYYQSCSQHTTPPYYRPPQSPEQAGQAESLNSPDCDDFGYGLELLSEQQCPHRNDNLGLGSCLPLAGADEWSEEVVGARNDGRRSDRTAEKRLKNAKTTIEKTVLNGEPLRLAGQACQLLDRALEILEEQANTAPPRHRPRTRRAALAKN